MVVPCKLGVHAEGYLGVMSLQHNFKMVEIRLISNITVTEHAAKSVRRFSMHHFWDQKFFTQTQRKLFWRVLWMRSSVVSERMRLLVNHCKSGFISPTHPLTPKYKYAHKDVHSPHQPLFPCRAHVSEWPNGTFRTSTSTATITRRGCRTPLSPRTPTDRLKPRIPTVPCSTSTTSPASLRAPAPR